MVNSNIIEGQLHIWKTDKWGFQPENTKLYPCNCDIYVTYQIIRNPFRFQLSIWIDIKENS